MVSNSVVDWGCFRDLLCVLPREDLQVLWAEWW